jgi:nicotinamidase/pyrazinamidase
MAKRSGLRIHLVVIDPQIDFCDVPGATLPVPGADADMKRLANFVDRVGPKLDDIHVTLDSHRLIDIAHPAWWQDSNGKQPPPFTLISSSDIKAGMWTPRNPAFRNRSLAYAEKLEEAGKYQLCIWPPHCLIGSRGHNVHEDLNAALQRWSEKEFAMVDYVTKGSNPWTEHYGGLMAEVPDPQDPGTSLNTDLLRILADADMVVVAGEALSHCVKATVTQIADNIGEEHIKKFHILTDCSSPVPAIPNIVDFPAIAQEWLREMQKRGMTLTTSTDFLS